ncbi:MAG: histidinol-phosphatase [Planctomycetales bacterium]|nr:histidinol-phosphatase [Planctomycetales bacterium]
MIHSTRIEKSLLQALDGRLALAVELAHAAGQSTLEHFQSSGLQVDRKGDASPVTVADRNAEQLIRELLQQSFPTDAILGEEFGNSAGTSEYQWIIDPIDGTKSFICGVPLYSTLVGVVKGRECLAGVIYVPALDEIIYAVRGQGAWHSKQDQIPQRCEVSQKSLEDGLFVVSQVDSFGKRGAEQAYRSFEKTAYVTRSWGDGYGYMLVATGRAELMVDPIANPWDLAAVQPIVEEAGGKFSSWRGEPHVFGGDGLGCNAAVYDYALEVLKECPSQTANL